MKKDKRTYFEEVYLENKDKIYRLCIGFTGNNSDADDLLQEILLKIWNNLESFKGNSQISTWVYRVATNTALLFVSRKKKLDNKRSDQLPEQLNLVQTERDTTTEQQVNQLYQAISNLKEIDRIVISLLLEEHSYKEIAEITGLEANHIGVKINRIKKELKKYLS